MLTETRDQLESLFKSILVGLRLALGHHTYTIHIQATDYIPRYVLTEHRLFRAEKH